MKTTEQGGVRGYAAGQQGKGRKRHLLVDTLGLILVVIVRSAAVQDRAAADPLWSLARYSFPDVAKIWADGGYSGQLLEWGARCCGWGLEIIQRSDTATGGVVLPKRWIVERTLGQRGRSRRLSKEYAYDTHSSETII